MKKKTIPVLLASALILSACMKPQPVQEEVRPVRTMTIGADHGASLNEYAGEVRARHETALAFRVGGKLISRLVDVGATVKSGQVLARLDTQDLKLNVEAMRAQVAAANADLAQAKLNLNRSQELLSKKFVSQAEVDNRLTALAAAQSKLDQALAQQKQAGNQEGYASLLADTAGVVTSVDAEAGQVVSAGQAIVHLAHDGEREVVIDVAEKQRGELAVGQPARVALWAQPEKSWGGKVREIAPAADAVTRTFRVRIAIAGGQTLPLGMSATVTLESGRPAANVGLPLSAVFGTGSTHKVWLVDPATGRVHALAVKVQELEDVGLRVSGLKNGDIVVTAGVHLLREGQVVRLIKNQARS